jgi:hypothetical protein
LPDFNKTLIFLTDLKYSVSNFIIIRPLEAEFFHADGQTDMTELIVAFRNFMNAPKTPVVNNLLICGLATPFLALSV